MRFRVSHVAREATTAEGQPLVRGSIVVLNREQQLDSFNARLIAEGQLISISAPDKTREDAEQRVPSNPNVEGGNG